MKPYNTIDYRKPIADYTGVDWINFFSAWSDEDLDKSQHVENKTMLPVFTQAVTNELTRRNYVKIATAGIDAELGFAELLDVL